MDFDFTEEQQLLADTTRELLSRGYDIEKLNAVLESDLGWNRKIWQQLAELGVLALGFEPEESGPLEAMVVLTEIGARLAPEPVLEAALIPGGLVAELGNDTQKAMLDEVAAGTKLLALAYLEPGMRLPQDELSTKAGQQGDAWTLSGTKSAVAAGDSADTLLVTAALPDGSVGLFLVDGAATGRRPYRTVDGHRGAVVDFDAVPAEPLGSGGDASDAVSRALVRYQAGLCAEAVGAMAEALKLTTEYLNARKQFGVPLKTFQTLTHRAADMYVSLELARSMTFYATMSLADGNVDPAIASRAKLQVARSGRHIAQEAIQLHGGIGVTAEYPVGHYAARLTAINNTLGTGDDHARLLSGGIGGYEAVAL